MAINYRLRIEACEAKKRKAWDKMESSREMFAQMVKKINEDNGTSFSTNVEEYIDINIATLAVASAKLYDDCFWTFDRFATARATYKEQQGLIERYTAMLAKKNAAATTEDEAVKKYKPALAEGCEGFRKVWLARNLGHAAFEYDDINAKVDTVKKIYDRLNRLPNISPRYFQMSHTRLRRKVEKAEAECYNIISHRAAKMTRSEYLEYTRERLEQHWDASMTKLAVKLLPFNLNHIKATATDMEDKGLECYITDGNRRIHARVIWAAEFSDIVTPHERYIITERTKK
jgi:hypothetical protein